LSTVIRSDLSKVLAHPGPVDYRKSLVHGLIELL